LSALAAAVEQVALIAGCSRAVLRGHPPPAWPFARPAFREPALRELPARLYPALYSSDSVPPKGTSSGASALQFVKSIGVPAMPSYKQLTAQLEKLHKEVAAAREKEIAQAIAEIKQKIAEYDLTAEELGFTSKRATGRKTVSVAKYRNPKTGETWSGRGRSPGWLAGKNRERFLIEG
jgi:DNA-binding protein H-NS